MLALSSTCPVDCAASPVHVVPVFVRQDLGQDGSCLRESYGGWCRQCLRFVLKTWICSPFWFPCPLIQQLEHLTGRHLQVYRKIPEENAQFPFIIHIIYLTWIKNGTLQSNTHLAELNTTLKDSELPIAGVENTVLNVCALFARNRNNTMRSVCLASAGISDSKCSQWTAQGQICRTRIILRNYSADIFNLSNNGREKIRGCLWTGPWTD